MVFTRSPAARRRSTLLCIAAALAALAACGGSDGSGGQQGAAGLNALVKVSAEATGLNCPSGGNRIDAGLDADASGVLDVTEVTSTQYACNGNPGMPGTAGLSSLVRVTSEPAGLNCLAGGSRIAVGLDDNGNRVLDTAEVDSTAYACQGATGAAGPIGATGPAGTNGSNGLSSLITIVAESAGSNCAYGGSRVTSGMDTNGNAVLDAGEVTSTTYTCNGAPGASLTWSVITASTTASPNTGYIVDSAARATVTLPASPSVGNVVRVSGLGAGGWQIGQDAGQSILTRGIPTAASSEAGETWIARESNRNWLSVTSSSDGTRLAAVASSDQIYTSSDSGVTWTPRESPRNWKAVASSSDGTRLVAVAYGGQIYTSSDSGVTWTARESVRNWYGVASSSDGIRLAAVVDNGQIYTSSDAGVTWAPRESNRAWYTVAMSADGTKLVAGVLNGQLYTSSDSGVTWTPRESSRIWVRVASSSDGTRLAAVVYTGQIYTSSDSGVTWTPRETNRDWFAVAVSADGTKMVAGARNGRLYTSTDAGVTWTARENVREWFSAAMSADGKKLVAVTNGEQIYTSTEGSTTTVGTGGWLRGEQYDAVELQYVGAGLWVPLSFTNNSSSGITGN